MTQKEKENLVNALGCINSTISELKYYKRSGWLSDEAALESAESTKEFINKILVKKRKK